MSRLLFTVLRKLTSQKGLGLIELVLALSLLSVVFALGYSFFFFGTGAFDRGESQQNVQQNARQAASFITDELRFATEVEILAEIPDPNEVGAGWHYIFIQTDDPNHIYLLNADGEKPIPGIIDDGTTYSPSSLLFQGTDSKVLDFSIAASKNNQNFSIATSVQPLNLNGNINGTNDGAIIRYRNDSFDGDPLPEGFAFIDKDFTRKYNSATDILVPIDNLKVPFTSETYECTFGTGRVGGNGSLIVPPSAGEITIDANSGFDLTWNVVGEILLGVNVTREGSADVKFRIISQEKDLIIYNESIGDKFIVIELESPKGGIDLGDSILKTKLHGDGIVKLTAKNEIRMGNAIIDSLGDGGLKIESTNGSIVLGDSLLRTKSSNDGVLSIIAHSDIKMYTAEIESFSDGYGLLLQSKNGSVDLGESTLYTKNSNDGVLSIKAKSNINSGIATIRSEANNGIYIESEDGYINAQNADLVSTNGASTATLVLKANNFINIDDAKIKANGSAVDGPALLIESKFGYISALRSEMSSANSGKQLKIIAEEDININQAAITSGGPIMVISGSNIYGEESELINSGYNNEIFIELTKEPFVINLQGASLKSDESRPTQIKAYHANNKVYIDDTCFKRDAIVHGDPEIIGYPSCGTINGEPVFPHQGNLAWVDVNGNGIFEEGTDYELTDVQLTVNPLTIPIGDLVLPEPVGDFISNGVINWDIKNGSLVSYVNIESTVTGHHQLRIKASNDIIISPGKTVTARCQQGLKIESTNGKVIINGAQLLSTDNNWNALVVIEAFEDILLEHATIKGSGSQGISVKSIDGMIKANGSSTFAYQGGWNCAIIIDAKEDVYIINAQFTNSSTNNPLTFKGEVGHYLYVEGAIINTSKVNVINLTSVGQNNSFN